MLQTIATKTIRDQRKALLWWVLGIVVFSVLIALVWPSIRDNPGIEDYLDALPPEIMVFFGGSGVAIFTPEGYLNAELFSFMLPIMFLVFTITLGSGLIAGEEERGRLEMLVTEPVSRHRVYLEQAAAIAVSSLVLAITVWVAIIAGALMVDLGISAWQVASAAISLWLMAIAFGALAMALGGLTGKRSVAVGATAGVAVLMYFLNALGGMVEVLDPLRPLSIFFYYSDSLPIANGLNFVHAGVLLLVSVVLTGLGMAGFERRDLRV